MASHTSRHQGTTRNSHQGVIDMGDINELLEELGRQRGIKSDDGMTVHEIREATGRGDAWVRRYIKRGLDAGVIKRGKRTIEGIDGVMKPVPVYGLVGDKNN